MDPFTPPVPNLPPERRKNNTGLIIFIAFDLLVTAALGFGIYYYFSNVPQKANDLAKVTQATQAANTQTAATETVTAVTSVPQPAANQLLSNEFTTGTAKVGDKVAGMELEKITVANADYSKLSDTNVIALFKGEATLSGTYRHDNEDNILGEQVCFEPDQKSTKLLPRVAGETRKPYGFCLSNLNEAKKQFPKVGGTGPATIKISDFEVVVYPGEGSNWAKLVEVIK